MCCYLRCKILLGVMLKIKYDPPLLALLLSKGGQYH